MKNATAAICSVGRSHKCNIREKKLDIELSFCVILSKQ